MGADPSDLLQDVPRELRAIILRCADGELSPNVVLMRLLIGASDPAQAHGALADAFAALENKEARSRVDNVIRLWSATPNAWDTVRAVIACMESQTSIAGWADSFDRAAQAENESGVALYALGRADLAEQTTTEVVEALQRWGTLDTCDAILEVGCGSGRFVEQLAAMGKRTVGIDVSPGMLQKARLRCRDQPLAALIRTSGRDLAALADDTFDLVLAIDSFPYLVATSSDLAAAHLCEAARVLRPAGLLAILNYSYSDDPKADAADVLRLASNNDFAVLRNGTRDFKLWDAATFLLQRM